MATQSFERLDFSKNPPVMDIPNLLDVQLKSFENFLQMLSDPLKRKDQGLQAVFNEIFPISDARGNFSLEFVSYNLGEPKYDVDECQERDVTYAAPLKATLRLMVKETVDGEKKVREVIEQEVYLGELPIITSKGTFIINGAERVIVSQLHRSPGVFFDEEIHPNGKRLFTARIIPYRGSWVEFTTDINDIMYAHIDRKRKIPVSVLLRALGYADNETILALYYGIKEINFSSYRKKDELVGRYLAADVVDEQSGTGEVIASANDEITPQHLEQFRASKAGKIKLLVSHEERDPQVIRNTLIKDTSTGEEDALKRIYNLLRPGDPPGLETAQALLDRLFFNPRRYDLAKVGRHKMNRRLNLDVPDDTTTLTKEDFVSIVDHLLRLKAGHGFTDDIDHLGNRRLRSVGELLSIQFSIGLSRMARIIKERMSLGDTENIAPYDLINARTISAVIKTFFGSSQLSQFMDQTNPLAELTHKRRLSALGPGGLTRERAGFEVRDVHYTHYGRMCPIETPEGPNIGLISSLSTYARVNEYGFLETPYRKVVNGKAMDEIVYLSADQEDERIIIQAKIPLDATGKIIAKTVTARFRSDYPIVDRERIEYMDVSPMQLVSAAAALIPFLEHDDANRALMGSNMQRQSVPLLRPEVPLVGTGLEKRVAFDSGVLVTAKHAGTVESVSANQVVINYSKGKEIDFTGFEGLEIHKLHKFRRSNQDTCINHKPIVQVGDQVMKGDVIADGPGTKGDELALGMNVLVAFMPWNGYNYEDAILLSEDLVKEDRFTSIHIEEFELQVRDTKRGMEEITREIPNMSEDSVRNLDEDGIIRVGAHVHSGDILVGKVTPKGETELSPEERLLRAIFGEKAGDVRDASLKAPPGMDGIVIDVMVFSRKERDDRAKLEEKKKASEIRRRLNKEIRGIREVRDERVRAILNEKTTARFYYRGTDEHVRAGRKWNERLFEEISFDNVNADESFTDDVRTNNRIRILLTAGEASIEKKEHELTRELERLARGDELAPGVVKLVKVYVAKKRKISVGDKMAGRHGNKGVVAKILPAEDMPYLEDGTPVEIVLNPLGVPSRMNLGQILETHLGWACKALGIHAATPVFDGATIEEIKEKLREAGLPESGKTTVYDGRTGEKFKQEVTVGYIYMLKLSHLVDDKIHARSIGPYSLVTQQPLGGKAQFGGQRFGEMEVWALEAYGAAFTLQELLTVKSDDVVGRSKVYEAIVKGDNPPQPGIPESFNVLVKELQSLGLDIHLEQEKSN